jgi:medium-chain acyl-[acyl-carrier-protein] hydrolase
MRLVLPLLRADFAATQTYSYTDEPPLACPITALGGLNDLEVSREELTAWRAQTTATFSLSMFPGDHFYLHTAERLLLDVLARALAQLARPDA